MTLIKIKKGLKLNIKGWPSKELNTLDSPLHVAILPEKIPFIKPRLKIEKGDRVKIGNQLFEDKRNPDIKFLSPGAGTIIDINFGRRRVIKEIIIELDKEEDYIEFEHIDTNTDQNTLIQNLVKGGIWPFIKALPFRDIASPTHKPPAIFVNMDNLEPFHPCSEVYLKGNEELFLYGIEILKKFTDNLIVYGIESHSFLNDNLQAIIQYTVSGEYPADDPGTLLYKIKTDPSKNNSWYINGQDLILLAQFIKTSRYPTDRIVAIGGAAAQENLHIKTRIGIPVKALTDFLPQTRYIAGGILRGHEISYDSYLGMYETSLTLLPQKQEKEFLGFLRPGINKHSHSKTFLSFFNKDPLTMDSGMHGEQRACVNCGMCASVCPVDILPQFTMKCILADEIEQALQHGLLDCVECGACTYVCTSKIEIGLILQNAKQSYYKEQK